MTISFLGTGTSQGVPIIACPCPVCQSPDPKDKRLRASIWVQTEDASVVVDTGPDFRQQMLRAGVPRLDAVVFTHSHKDHTAGLDDIRAFNYFQGGSIPLYADEETESVLRREYSYAFQEPRYPGTPEIHFIRLRNAPFHIGSQQWQPVKVLHYKLDVYGFRIGKFCYITDANYIAPEELHKLEGLEVLVLNALRHEKHISHFTLEEAIAIAQKVAAPKTFFTHISHQLGRHEEVSPTLPAGMFLAYDGLCLNL
jgi:phosphoribosyl 1,2-cyclic phosphate phosphodiesterase